jgi:hypothetical protein
MTLKTLIFSWNVMWALSYLIVAAVAPNIEGTTLQGQLIFVPYGLALLAATLLSTLTTGKKQTAGRAALIILASLSVYSGVASWSGAAAWNIPFADKAPFQVSMALLDLVGAASMLYLAFDGVIKEAKE